MEGDTIGQILVIEFDETDSGVFDEVMEVLQKHKSFETVQFKSENVISLPGLIIYPNQRKMYRDRQEIPLTTKEYELLCLLATNHSKPKINIISTKNKFLYNILFSVTKNERI